VILQYLEDWLLHFRIKVHSEVAYYNLIRKLELGVVNIIILAVSAHFLNHKKVLSIKYNYFFNKKY